MKKNLYLAVTLLLLATGSGAQVFSDQLLFLQSQTQFMTIQSQIYSDMSKQNIERDEANRKRDQGEGFINDNPGSVFSYVANPRIIDEVETEILYRLKQINPASAKNLEAVLTREKPYPSYLTLFREFGLDAASDYADVFTGYMLGMWRIANGRSDNPTDKQIRSVRKQVMGNVDISALSDRQKQEKAAYLIYDFIFANEAYEGSRKSNNRKLMQEDSDATYNRFLKEYHLDLRNMVITEKGLTFKN